MWYAIIAEDSANSLEKRMKARPAHLERIEALLAEGRVLLAGPHPAIDAADPGDAGFTGSLMIVDFPDLESATEWAETDPYVEAGVFQNVTVKPFRKTLP